MPRITFDPAASQTPAAFTDAARDGPERAAWLAERCGKLTASKMHVALAFKKDGTPTQARSDLQRALVAERITGLNMRNYVNTAMEWGIQYEPEAKLAYMRIAGVILQESGFYDHPMIDMCGATPDGEIGRDGLIEIKCPTTETFIGWVKAGIVPPEHEPQMALQLACTGRKWCEFVAFDPRIKDEKRRLFIRRFTPEAHYIQLIESHAKQFLDEVEQMFREFTEAA